MISQLIQRKNYQILIQNAYLFCKQIKNNSEEVTVQTFSKLDIRIGKILECWKHPDSENLYCEKVELMQEPSVIRTIGSGLQKYVPLENMSGTVLVMSNLKVRKLAGFSSQGMVLCSTSQDGKQCWPLFVSGKIGQRIYLEGHQNLFDGKQLLKPYNTKRKFLEKCLPFFKTDEQGFACWKQHKLMHSGSYICSNIFNGTIS